MDALDRIFWRLAETVQRSPPTALLTVAEVYQTRVPYRLARAELGFAELAAYEHALLRLLTGERGYARLEDPEVAHELARELRSPNPILGVYRDYPDRVVHLRAVAADPVSPPVRDDSAVPPTPPAVPAASAPAAHCPNCAVDLPERRVARFCPSCGCALRRAPCPQCGTELEPQWAFCIDCGTGRGRASR